MSIILSDILMCKDPYCFFLLITTRRKVTDGQPFHNTCTLYSRYLSLLQELPKYLRGYHVCTKEEMVNIAALLFKIKVGNDKSQLVMIPKMLKELVPADQLKAMSENEWKKV